MSTSVLEIAQQRTAELDSKPDPQSWLALGCVVVLGLAVYLMYIEPYTNDNAMRASALVAAVGILMWARAAWVSDFGRRIRGYASVTLTLVALAPILLAFTTT